MKGSPAHRIGGDFLGRLLAPLAVALLAAACSSSVQAIPAITDVSAETKGPQVADDVVSSGLPTKTAPASDPTSPPVEPTLEPTLVPVQKQEISAEQAPASLEPTAPADIGVFAEMRDNLASGELAPDFDALTLGNSTFSLSAQSGAYVLVVPTAIGCGECVFTMDQLAAAYPEYRDENLKLVLLNLYPKDVPESWEAYVEAFPDLGATWGVVSSVGFVVDYDIRSLGTILLVDPEGKLVFRSNYPLIEDELRQLFELATS